MITVKLISAHNISMIVTKTDYSVEATLKFKV